MTTAKKKKQMRATADKLWIYCVIKKWGQNSCVSGEPAEVCHHYFAKGLYPILRYSLENGCPLTNKEHFFLHHRGDPLPHQKILASRGKKWYNDLEKIAKEKHGSFQTVNYYQSNIEKLQKYLEK